MLCPAVFLGRPGEAEPVVEGCPEGVAGTRDSGTFDTCPLAR